MATKKKEIDFAAIAQRAAGISIGSIGGFYAANQFLAGVDPKWSGLGLIAVGSIIPAMMPQDEKEKKEGKPHFFGAIGDGLAAAGAIKAAQGFAPDLFVKPTEDDPAPAGVGNADTDLVTDDGFEDWPIDGYGDNEGGVGDFEQGEGGVGIIGFG